LVVVVFVFVFVFDIVLDEDADIVVGFDLTYQVYKKNRIVITTKLTCNKYQPTSNHLQQTIQLYLTTTKINKHN